MTRRSPATVPFVLAIAVPVAVFLGRMLSETGLLWVGALSKVLFLAVGSLYAWRNARRFEAGNPARLGWLLLGAGLTGFTLAQASICAYQLFRGVAVPFPSVGDVFFLIGYPLLIAALFAFLRSYAAAGFPIGPARERWLLAGALVVVCTLIGIPILRPIVTTPAPALAKALNVAYPILDFVLLIPTVLLLRVTFRFRGGMVWKTWIALLGGFLFSFGADTLFAYLSALGEARFQNLIDVLYILAFGLIARGVFYQHELLSS